MYTPITPKALQVIFITSNRFRTSSLNVVGTRFGATVTGLLDRSDPSSLRRVADLATSSALPSLVILDTLGLPPAATWQLLKDVRAKLPAAASGPIGLVVDKVENPPFSLDLISPDGQVWLIPNMALEGCGAQLEDLIQARLARLTLVAPEQVFSPSKMELALPALNALGVSSSNIQNVLRGCRVEQRVLPCFNAKCPSMIWLLTMIARKMAQPIILEISPAELIRHFAMNGDNLPSTVNSIRERLIAGMAVFAATVKAATATVGATDLVFAQLDHARSAELVTLAYQVGFDIAMFDASTRPLSVNACLTQKLGVAAHNSGLAIEGEVDAVDDLRDRLTRKEDAVRFSKISGVDLLAVAAGQRHGSDYTLPVLVESIEEVATLKHACSGLGVRRFILESIETTLSERANTLSSEDLCSLRALHLRILLDKSPGHGTVFQSLYDLPDPLLTEEIEVSAQALRSKSEIRCLTLLKKIHDCDVSHSDHAISRHVQVGLLHMINQALKERLGDAAPGLVLHGGSSISQSCLSDLSAVGVAKVNFGSSTFRAFFDNMIDTNESRLFGPIANDARSQRRLIEADWIDPTKRDVEKLEYLYRPFLEFVTHRYIRPLNAKPKATINTMHLGSNNKDTCASAKEVVNVY